MGQMGQIIAGIKFPVFLKMFLTVVLICSLFAVVNTRGCGQRVPADVNRVSRVVGGTDAVPNTWPWQVSIQMSGTGADGSRLYHHCGGSIISNYWILTVEHCRDPVVVYIDSMQWTDIEVIAGLQNIKDYYLWVGNRTVNTNRPEMYQANPYMTVHEPEATFVPPDYKGDLDGEIMLIKLKTPIMYTDQVSPVCLPKQWQEFKTHSKCWLTGWGTTNYGGDSPVSLQEVKLNVLDRELCGQWYTIPVTDNMLCAGISPGGGYGPCHGDSGGPLVCQYRGHWVQAGIVSWGGVCGGAKTPGVFVSVPNFVDWIHDTISQNP